MGGICRYVGFNGTDVPPFFKYVRRIFIVDTCVKVE